MMLDSYTPPDIQWRGRSALTASNGAMSTSLLSPSSSLPRQQFAEDFELAGSLCAEASPEAPKSTDSGRCLRTVAPKLRRPTTSLDDTVLLKKMDGFVTKIFDDGFAILFEENAEEGQSIEAEFDFEELSDSDRDILAEGMPAVWFISRERANGGIKRCSKIELRRQPAPTKAEVAAAARNLDEWFASQNQETGR